MFLLVLLLLLLQLAGQLLAHDLAERSLAGAEATQRALPAIGTDGRQAFTRRYRSLRQFTISLTRRHICARTTMCFSLFVHCRRNTGPDLLRTFVGQ
uniref:Putative secreted protein n=1 Tax=Anopheles marajoara TaxID=58244 RepID=A0A2M4C984_9DIPT